MSHKAAVISIFAACILNFAVGAAFFYARKVDPAFSAQTAILMRVLLNIPFLLLPWLLGRGRPVFNTWSHSRELWLWGIFGVLTVLTYYEAASLLGSARANLMNAGSGLLVTVFGTFLARQKAVWMHWLCAAGAVVGIYLLGRGGWSDQGGMHGLELAVLSGVFSALAYLMVAREGTRHSGGTIVLHWTLVNLLVIGVFYAVEPHSWPSRSEAWSVLIAGGLCAVGAQYLTTWSYQKASASLIACLSLATPIAGVAFDLYAFQLPVTATGIAGMAIIAVCGIAVPLAKPG